MQNWRNELHGAPPGGLVSLHMTALVARVQGLGTRARRWTLWRQVVRRDSAVQEGLHEHTLDANHLEAGIPTPRDRRQLTRSWNGNDFIDLHWRLHCVPPCTTMATSYNLCYTHSVISTPSKHLLPHTATSHQLRVHLHPVAAVHSARESVGVRAPSLCGLQQLTGKLSLAIVPRPRPAVQPAIPIK